MFSQALGLMFRKKQNLLMTFPKERKISLHMFFVFFPIDVIWLNKEKRIIAMKENLKTFSISAIDKLSQHIIELPQGTIKRTNTHINDLIEF